MQMCAWIVFRALLGNHPDGTLEGIFEFLSTFREYSYTVPEACSLSKSLVRCLTDIMEVLCAAPNGLLNNVRFLRSSDPKGPAAQLPKLWTSMNQALALILSAHPAWARYYNNEEMIVWMRTPSFLAAKCWRSAAHLNQQLALSLPSHSCRARAYPKRC